MKHLAVSLAIAILAIFTAPAALVAQFSAGPAIVWVTPTDSAASGRITVRNEGDVQAQFRVSLGDFDQAEGGENAFFPVGTQEGSCSGRMRVTPDVTVLRPGDTQELRVEVDPGEQPCWSVVFVQGAPAGAAGGITVSQRIAVKVYGAGRTAGAREGEVVSVVGTPGNKLVEVTFEFRNGSASPIRPEGRIELRSVTGETLAQAVVDPFSVLPGRVRKVTVEVPAELVAGRYVAVPVLDFGGDYLAGGQGLFRIQ